MIDRLTIDRIMAAADIVDVVSDFVTLRRSGSGYKGLCPFHEEKTPSFMVSPSKQVCKCFSCGGGGNVVHFIMQHEQMTYPEALKWLGRKYGIEVRDREQTDEEKLAASKREAMFVVNEWARDYFTDQLHNNVDGLAIGMSYFRRRGLRDDIIRRFQLGYSPEQRDALTNAALAKGFEKDYLLATGLSFATEQRGLMDRYHGRVIFPVHSVSGRVVAFGGRYLGDSKARGVGKYVNSPESEIYSKKHELYGLYLAKQAIVKHDRCYLVEGYLDVISMYQSGVENVVASSGTALTPEQIRLIHRFTNHVTILYDGDAAGIHASIRGIDLLLSEGLNVKVLLLPDGEDPDSFAQKHSAEEFRRYIEERQTDFIQFKVELLMSDAAHDPMKRAEAIQSIVRSIAMIPSDIVRTVYIHELSARLAIEESTIVAEVSNALRQINAERRNPQSASLMPKSPEAPSDPLVTAPSGVPSSAAPGGLDEDDASAPEALRAMESASAPLTISPARQAALSGTSPARRQLAICERQILEVIIRYGEYPIIQPEEPVEQRVGRTPLPLPAKEEEPSPIVAPYIAAELSAEGVELASPLARAILTEAAELAGQPEWRASHYFTLHSNPAIGELAMQLVDERHVLSTSQQKIYIPEERRLLEIVPRVINDYKYALIAVEKEDLLHRLRASEVQDDPDAQFALMARLVELNRMEQHFAKVLGDRVLTR